MAGEREADVREVEAPASIVRLNLEIAQAVQKLNTADLVEVLSGRASWLLHADDNQNQNQGSRSELD